MVSTNSSVSGLDAGKAKRFPEKSPRETAAAEHREIRALDRAVGAEAPGEAALIAALRIGGAARFDAPPQ
ncbi:MAG: hypothetical protein PS018_00140 [bacterium]|nr:hypothetical protein [bacterium]